jgi:predicted DNA-binding protein
MQQLATCFRLVVSMLEQQDAVSHEMSRRSSYDVPQAIEPVFASRQRYGRLETQIPLA